MSIAIIKLISIQNFKKIALNSIFIRNYILYISMEITGSAFKNFIRKPCQ